jgi:hypothetical protein
MNEHNFDTSMGQHISSGLQQLFARFDLNATFGTAPQDYFLSAYVHSPKPLKLHLITRRETGHNILQTIPF